MARQCPRQVHHPINALTVVRQATCQAVSKTSTSSNKCFNCGEAGHMARQCPRQVHHLINALTVVRQATWPGSVQDKYII